MQVLSATASLVFLFPFVFVLKSVLYLLFTSRYALEAFLILYIIIYLIPQCLLIIMKFISWFIIQHGICPMPCLVLFVFVNKHSVRQFVIEAYCFLVVVLFN